MLILGKGHAAAFKLPCLNSNLHLGPVLGGTKLSYWPNAGHMWLAGGLKDGHQAMLSPIAMQKGATALGLTQARWC